LFLFISRKIFIVTGAWCSVFATIVPFPRLRSFLVWLLSLLFVVKEAAPLEVVVGDGGAPACFGSGVVQWRFFGFAAILVMVVVLVVELLEGFYCSDGSSDGGFGFLRWFSGGCGMCGLECSPLLLFGYGAALYGSGYLTLWSLSNLLRFARLF
jgi:hypothetical protein